jgi:triphosphoribosyl-dephospho-CoA synthase
VTATYLVFLAAEPDTLIARKFGKDAAAEVAAKARGVEERFAASAKSNDMQQELIAFDRKLKAAGLNPGTSADLTVATLFAHELSAAEARS